MPDDRKSLPEEVAGLTEAVRELRDREVAQEIGRLREEIAALRAQQLAHHCQGHWCGMHWYYTPTWIGGAAGCPNTVYYTTHTVPSDNPDASATLTQGTNVCDGGNTLSVAEQTGIAKQQYQMPYFTNAAAGGGYGTYTVPVDQPLTVNCYIDMAGAAPAAVPYVVNYAG